MRNGLVILPFSQKTLKFITSRLRNSLRRNAQKAGQSLQPGAVSAPGVVRKEQAKSPFGATEIGRLHQSLPLIPAHTDSAAEKMRRNRLGRPAGAIYRFSLRFILGRKRPRLYSSAALRLKAFRPHTGRNKSSGTACANTTQTRKGFRKLA